jgi:hypothetical protein
VEVEMADAEGAPPLVTASVEYLGEDGAVGRTLTATSRVGVALVRGLRAGSTVRARGRKAGCVLGSGPWGPLPLEAGVLSATALYLE